MLTDVIIANKTYAKLNIPGTEKLDNIAMRVIKQDCPDFLLPMKTIDIDGETEIKYEITDGLRMSYLPDVLQKKDFITLLEQMILPFRTCNDWFLDYHNIYLNKDYIVVGKNYMTVKYAYLPAEKYAQTDEDIMAFFQEFILNINLKDDPMYAMNLYRYTREKKVNLKSILDYILKDKQNKELDNSEKDEDTYSQRMENSKIEYSKKLEKEEKAFEQVIITPEVTTEEKKSDFGKQDIANGLIGNLFGDVQVEEKSKKKDSKGSGNKQAKEKNVKSGSLFGGLLGNSNKGKNQEKASEIVVEEMPVQKENVPHRYVSEKVEQVRPSAYVPEDATDVTDISGEELNVSDENKLVLQLKSETMFNCPKKVEIDMSRGYATVGRYDKMGNMQADYNFDASLSFISRRHFRVEKNGVQWRIIDLGSSNGTLLNEEMLVPNMAYTLNTGDCITLSRKYAIIYQVC